MVEYIFGRYLVSSGRITDVQLDTIVEKMDSVRVKLGLIAVAEGFMSLKQAEEVNRLQAIMDKRFGDIAVEKGYLTEEQVSKLLKYQGNAALAFVQALIDEGVCTLEETDGLWEQFRKDNGLSMTELEAIRSDEVERIVPFMLPDECKEYEQLVSLFVRSMIRLVDRHTSVGRAEVVNTCDCKVLAIQRMQGNGTLIDSVMEGTDGLLVTTSVYGKMEFGELDEDALDSAGELLNCVNGLFATAESKDGSFWELLPQEYSMNGVDLPEAKACKVPVYVGSRLFYFLITRYA